MSIKASLVFYKCFNRVAYDMVLSLLKCGLNINYNDNDEDVGVKRSDNSKMSLSMNWILKKIKRGDFRFIYRNFSKYINETFNVIFDILKLIS